MDKIVKEQQLKIAEARRKKREENAPLCKLCVPNPINAKPNSPFIDLLVPTPEEKGENKREEEGKDCTTDYYLQSPIYVACQEEDAPTLVNNLVPEATLEEKKDTDRTEEDKTAEDKRDLIGITDEYIGIQIISIRHI